MYHSEYTLTDILTLGTRVVFSSHQYDYFYTFFTGLYIARHSNLHNSHRPMLCILIPDHLDKWETSNALATMYHDGQACGDPSYASTPALAIPSSRAPINPPRLQVRAFKVIRVSRYAPSRGHARFIEPLSRRFRNIVRRRAVSSHVLFRTMASRWRRDADDPSSDREMRSFCDHATWVNRNERLRRSGAALALRVYRGLKAYISLPGVEVVHGGAARGERTRHVTMATVLGVAALARRLDPAPRGFIPRLCELSESRASRRGCRYDTFERLKTPLPRNIIRPRRPAWNLSYRVVPRNSFPFWRPTTGWRGVQWDFNDADWDIYLNNRSSWCECNRFRG